MARGVNGGEPVVDEPAGPMVSCDLLAHGLQADPKGLERLGRHALTLVDEAQQDVLGADEIVVEQSRLFLGQDQDPSGSVSETFEHARPPAPTLPAAPLFRRSAMRNGSLRGRRCRRQTQLLDRVSGSY